MSCSEPRISGKAPDRTTDASLAVLSADSHLFMRPKGSLRDAAFFATLRQYVAQFAGENVETSDFITIAETNSGQDLDSLFNAWLYSNPMPELPG